VQCYVLLNLDAGRDKNADGKWCHGEYMLMLILQKCICSDLRR